MTDAEVAAITALIVFGVWIQRPLPVVGIGIALLLIRLDARVALLGTFGGLMAVVGSQSAWNDVRPDHLGPFVGWACLVTDPAPRSGAVVAVFEIEGERFETWARGSPRRRLSDHLAGECARVTGVRRPIAATASRRAAVRHVVGGLDLDTVGDWITGSPMDRASNRVRRLFGKGASLLPTPDDALFAGLVIGDDRHEPAEMIVSFRRSGLSHLTAVSGANVAFMLAAAGPLLRRLRPVPRWLLTLAVIAWFVALTRFEPSILRAGVMAAVASTGYLLGRERPPGRVLAIAVGGLVLVDPLLVWSVGFWLSVAATGGVALLGAPLSRVIPGPHWIKTPVGVTLGAQLAVAPISLAVFGSLPLVSIPANLLAVPVAGLVMLYGLPAGLIAGALLDHGSGHGVFGVLASVIQLPSAVGTRWVSAVASLAERVEPAPPWPMIGWILIILVIAARAVSNRARRVWKG